MRNCPLTDQVILYDTKLFTNGNVHDAHTFPNLFAFYSAQLFSPEQNLLKTLREEIKVLVIGAGGLGCEILKDLALSGIGCIHVIGNYDTENFVLSF